MQRNPSSSSSTSTTAAPARRASSTEDSGSITNLPGPRQITTHPGVSGTNPLTGERQRRRGVSGPPSGLFFNYILSKGPSLNDVRSLGGGGVSKNLTLLNKISKFYTIKV